MPSKTDYSNWVRPDDSGGEYDPERYDRDDPDECQLCGAELKSGGGRGGVKVWCPECDVTVMLL